MRILVVTATVVSLLATQSIALRNIIDKCPYSCGANDTTSWISHHSTTRLAACNQTMLLNLPALWLIQITIKARKSCHRRGLFIPMLGWITSDSMHIRREMISPQFPDLLLPYHTLRSKFSLIIFYFLGNLDPTVFSEVNRAWQQDDGISTALILSASPNRIRQHPTKWPVTTNLSNSR
jgi:hypothetical protein